MLSTTLRAPILVVGLVTAVFLAETRAGDIVADPNRVYYGEPELAEKPGCIAANDVFMAIPAYRKIVEEGIGKDDPRYWLLMEEANRLFRRALRRADRDEGYDLIGELGSIQVDGAPAPDITAIVVRIARELVREE